MKISPSILAANFANLEKDIKSVEEDVDYLHIDIMDGHFVPNISFGLDITKDISKITSKPLDVHLMIEEPLKYLDGFLELNPEYITVHYEIIDNEILEKIIEKIENKNKENMEEGVNKKIKLGLSISPDTPYEVVIPYLEKIDLILVMSVYPGFYGQEFIEDTTYKIERLREIIDENEYTIQLEVDGGINDKTIKLVQKCDIVVAGSYIFKSDNYKERIEKLKLMCTDN